MQLAPRETVGIAGGRDAMNPTPARKASESMASVIYDEGFAAGFRAGIERAAKACENLNAVGEELGRWDYIAAVRALLYEPQEPPK
jgi:hypothetical protein